MEQNILANETKQAVVITPEGLLERWQGHRRLTRKTIKAFPEDKLFSYSIGEMRPFSVLALEMLDMAEPSLNGIITNKWISTAEMNHINGKSNPQTREELLKRWDETTDRINELWEQIPDTRFQEEVVAFGQWPGPVYSLLDYIIDNEIHHRGQGYVYLRSLGMQPPVFWDRE